MSLEAKKDLNGNRRHTHSGLAAVRPHNVDLGPVDHSMAQPDQAPTATQNGLSTKPDMPTLLSSIKEVRALRAIHGIKPPVQQRY